MRDYFYYFFEEFYLFILIVVFCDIRDEIYIKYRCVVRNIRMFIKVCVLCVNYRLVISVYDSKCFVLILLKMYVLLLREKKIDFLKCKVSIG